MEFRVKPRLSALPLSTLYRPAARDWPSRLVRIAGLRGAVIGVQTVKNEGVGI
jgi:hypothetical protein